MAVRVNESTNPSFEIDLTGWVVLAGSTTGMFWRDTSSRHQTLGTTATSSLRVNTSGTQSNGVVYATTLAAGTYTISVWAQILASTTNAALIVKAHASGAILGTEQHWTTPNNSWTRKSTTFTLATSTAVDVIVGVGIGTGGASAGSARFDEVLIEASSTLDDYFDGGFPSDGTTTYAWTGTAGLSTSTASSGTSTPPPPPPTTGGWSLVETNDFAVDGALDNTRWYTKAGFAGTSGDGYYHTDRTVAIGGQAVITPDQDWIGGFDSRHRPITYGKWDVWFKMVPVKGYKGVIFLWPDARPDPDGVSREHWSDGEWDFVEMTDTSGATFQIFFHKPGNPTDNSKNTRVSHNITAAFTKATIEKLPDRVTVLVNDLKVYETMDTAWVGTTPCHLVVQVDVGMPDNANGVGVRANYPANTNPRFQLFIDQVDIYVPATVSSSAPLSGHDSGASSDSGTLQTTRVTLFSTDQAASRDTATLTVGAHILYASDQGKSQDSATLTVGSSVPTVVLSGSDQGASLDSGSLYNAPQYLVAVDTGTSSDYATLTVEVDLSIRPGVGTVTEEIYGSLAPLNGADGDYGWALLRFIASLSDAIQWTDDLVRDSDDGPGWSSVMDLDRIPDDGLPWLAQFVGVDTIDELDSVSQRLRIRETSGYRRGTVAAIEGAARQYLIGTRSVVIQERDTNPYHLKVTVFAAETPEPEKTGQAVQDQKPAGLVLQFVVSSGATYGALTATNDTYAQLSAAYPTYPLMKLAVLV